MEEKINSRFFTIPLKEPVEQLPSLTLAYLGDVVYELMVRQYLVAGGMVNVNKLHSHTVKFVKAQNQAQIMKQILPQLTGIEESIARRGRNVKSHPPKNVNLADYKYATAFECLAGYYYLSRQWDKLDWLMDNAIEVVNKGEGKIYEGKIN